MTDDRIELRCVGADGEIRSFGASIEREADSDLILIRVFCAGPDADYWFYLRLRPYVSGNYQIDAINRNRPDCGRLGIPDALLPEMARQLSCRIYSSVKGFNTDTSEHRTREADKMWKRLVEKGIATYLKVEDRFVCPSF